MFSTRFPVAAIAMLMTAAPCLAQTTPAARPGLPPLLRQWAGTWQGTGWLMTAAAERVEFDLTESVSEKAGATVLLLEGHGTRTDSAGRGRPTHDGISLIFRDAAGHYRWHGHEATTGLVDTELALLASGVQWSIHPSGGAVTVRFTIMLDADVWREFGEVSTDGRAWNRFMEMTLHRTN